MTHRGPFQPLPFCDSVILFANGTLQNAAWGLRKTARLALEQQAGTGSEEEAGSQVQGSHVEFSHTPLSCRKSSALPFGSSRAPPHSVLHQQSGSGESRGAETAAQRRPLRPGSLQFLSSPDFFSRQDRHGGPIQVVRQIWLKWAIPFQARQGLAVGSKESAVIRKTTGLLSRTRNIPKSPLLQQHWVTGKGKSIKYTEAKTLCRYKG